MNAVQRCPAHESFIPWLRLAIIPSGLSGGLAGSVLALATLGWVVDGKEIPAAHPAIRCSDFVEKGILPDGAVRFHRILDVLGRGYRWDNPGARVGFRTDARTITVHLRYSEKHTSPSARASVGLFTIDGRSNSAWTFTSRSRDTVRPGEEVAFSLPVPKISGFHDYAVIMPYGDSVDHCGLTVNDSATFAAPPQRPAIRYVAYGDSVTHGFTASQIGFTYAYRLAESRGWQLVNLGLGGRTAQAAEGDAVGRLGGDVVTVLIGVNDWQSGIAPADYRANMHGLLRRIRAFQSDVPIYVITPLWVSAKWQPAKARFPLEEYRQALRVGVAEQHDPSLRLIEGPGLIGADERYFDAVCVHPNDAGFAQMVERLTREIAPLTPK